MGWDGSEHTLEFFWQLYTSWDMGRGGSIKITPTLKTLSLPYECCLISDRLILNIHRCIGEEKSRGWKEREEDMRERERGGGKEKREERERRKKIGGDERRERKEKEEKEEGGGRGRENERMERTRERCEPLPAFSE